ncbi:MAG: hypothetical protein WC815_21555 [Vicinamibacterales bacterium]
MANAKPTEKDMQVRCVGTEAVVAADELDLAEPAKEEEEIISANSRLMEVALSDAVLTKRWRPTGLSFARGVF